MSNENVQSKIDLLEEQIENIERSGFFTEAEIDRAVVSLKSELVFFQNMLSNHADSSLCYEEQQKPLYGMSPEEYTEGMKYHNECFDRVNKSKLLEIDVVDAEILSQKEV
ncbi:hypothetical protein [Flavobacterium denitrificans]|uniref:hypothetical protein n=1 Tax=Flavobacterium denitrificans TaxID=281361 RepID=UPI000415CB00|nr:hypothetical protein [Flavobacterium denitrificans]